MIKRYTWWMEFDGCKTARLILLYPVLSCCTLMLKLLKFGLRSAHVSPKPGHPNTWLRQCPRCPRCPGCPGWPSHQNDPNALGHLGHSEVWHGKRHRWGIGTRWCSAWFSPVRTWGLRGGAACFANHLLLLAEVINQLLQTSLEYR